MSSSTPTIVTLPVEDAAASAEDLLSGLRYAVEGEVARGGMGAILSARQVALHRAVAMKVMLADGADALRFVEEAQVTGQLEHPNIVPVHELGRDERGQLFYTMKFVRGITLKKVLALLAEKIPATQKKYPLPALLTIFQKACDALAFAHSRGVLHRDLKPENIMIGDFGEVLVMDWGLAKIIGQADRPGAIASARRAEGDAGSTMAGTVMGTPTYMSPEQARGEVEALDERSDVYALGAILYEILALRPAVSGRTAHEVLVKVGGGEVARLPTAGHHDSLVAVVHKAMAHDRADRYRSVAALQEDIAAYQGGFATSAEHAGFARQFFLAVLRHKAIAAAAVIALFTGLGFGGKAIVEGRRAEREAKRANATLAELKKTAPTLLALAESEAGVQRFASAVEKVDAALALDPALPGARWRRAWFLLAQEKFAECAEALRAASAAEPALAADATAILPILDARVANSAAPWNPVAAERLLKHCQKVGAGFAEIVLAKKFGAPAAERHRLVKAQMDRMKTGGGVATEGNGELRLANLPAGMESIEWVRGLGRNTTRSRRRGRSRPPRPAPGRADGGNGAGEARKGTSEVGIEYF